MSRHGGESERGPPAWPASARVETGEWRAAPSLDASGHEGRWSAAPCGNQFGWLAPGRQLLNQRARNSRPVNFSYCGVGIGRKARQHKRRACVTSGGSALAGGGVIKAKRGASVDSVPFRINIFLLPGDVGTRRSRINEALEIWRGGHRRRFGK